MLSGRNGATLSPGCFVPSLCAAGGDAVLLAGLQLSCKQLTHILKLSLGHRYLCYRSSGDVSSHAWLAGRGSAGSLPLLLPGLDPTVAVCRGC